MYYLYNLYGWVVSVYPVGVWVCLLGAGSAFCAEVCLCVQLELSSSADRPAVSPAVMPYHVGWYLLLGCLLLDLLGLHVQGQRRRDGKVLPTTAHTYTAFNLFFGVFCSDAKTLDRSEVHSVWRCF